MFEALLKSQSDSRQQRHQEFALSVLGKLGDIFSSIKMDVFLKRYTNVHVNFIRVDF